MNGNRDCAESARRDLIGYLSVVLPDVERVLIENGGDALAVQRAFPPVAQIIAKTCPEQRGQAVRELARLCAHIYKKAVQDAKLT